MEAWSGAEPAEEQEEQRAQRRIAARSAALSAPVRRAGFAAALLTVAASTAISGVANCLVRNKGFCSSTPEGYLT